MAVVTLSEVEFHKLMRHSEAVTLLETQAELWLAQTRQRIADTRAAKDAYFVSLQKVHPELKLDTQYVPDEQTLTLTTIEPIAE